MPALSSPRGGWVTGSALGGSRVPPVTALVLACQVLTFLADFFLGRPVSAFLDFHVSWWLARPWTALTYPLHGPSDPLSLLLFGYVFYWVASDLERRWGSLELGMFLGGITLTAAASFVAASVALGPVPPLSGLTLPLAATFLAWCMLNPEASILLFFVLPVKARWLGYADLALLYFTTGPVLGLFACVAPLAAWWYVRRGRRYRLWAASAPRPRPERREHRPAHPWWKDLLHPVAAWQRRKKLREFRDWMKRQGLDGPGPSDPVN